MAATALMGLQWGDEGKGKLVDLLSADADWVVRCQGGSNAGHTVKVGEETTVLHLVPSGILAPEARCVIGNGVVIDPAQLLSELDGLRERGVVIEGRLFISDRAHVVFPHHKQLDSNEEEARAGRRIGTTGRGIGPAYEDKVGRRGIRMHELVDPSRLEGRLASSGNGLLGRLGQAVVGELDQVLEDYRGLGERLRPYVTDTVRLLHDSLSRGERLFLEGAQGFLLDIDFGTYPFVTSSNTVVGGLLAGSGLPARALTKVVGVLKAYTTRVGEGPFPTELNDASGERLRDRGAEYGATTGRPRRCGWFDAVAARFAVEINGVDEIALTQGGCLVGMRGNLDLHRLSHRDRRNQELPFRYRSLGSGGARVPDDAGLGRRHLRDSPVR